MKSGDRIIELKNVEQDEEGKVIQKESSIIAINFSLSSSCLECSQLQ